MQFFLLDSQPYVRGERLLSGSDFKRKSLRRAVIRGAGFEVIGRHGCYRIIEIKVRGKPSLRYVRS